VKSEEAKFVEIAVALTKEETLAQMVGLESYLRQKNRDTAVVDKYIAGVRAALSPSSPATPLEKIRSVIRRAVDASPGVDPILRPVLSEHALMAIYLIFLEDQAKFVEKLIGVSNHE